MAFIRCIGCILCRGTCLWGWGLDLKSWGQCSAAFDGFRSRHWSESNESNESKVSPSDFIQVSPSPIPTLGLPNQMKADAATEANESKAGPKGLDFKCIRIVISGPWSECNESSVGPKARTFDAWPSLDALAAFYGEAPAYGVGSGSKVLGPLFSCIRCI